MLAPIVTQTSNSSTRGTRIQLSSVNVSISWTVVEVTYTSFHLWENITNPVPGYHWMSETRRRHVHYEVCLKTFKSYTQDRQPNQISMQNNQLLWLTKFKSRWHWSDELTKRNSSQGVLKTTWLMSKRFVFLGFRLLGNYFDFWDKVLSRFSQRC